MYLWHWPVIALAAALAGSGPTSAWEWVIETGVTIALAAASWRFIETPILQHGLRATFQHWHERLADVRTRPASRRRDSVPVAVAAVTVIAVAVAVFGVVRPAEPATPTGLLRQVAEGQRISTASQSVGPGQPTAGRQAADKRRAASRQGASRQGASRQGASRRAAHRPPRPRLAAAGSRRKSRVTR